MEFIFISIIYAGLYFYGGLGASSILVSWPYTIYFLVFMSVFVFFYRLKIPISHIISNSVLKLNINGTTTFIDDKRNVQLIIFSYISLHFVSLLYPDFELKNIISPPVPNVIDALRESIDKTAKTDFLVKIIFYFKLLLLPFYYLCLSKFKKSSFLLFIFLFIPLYLEYCAEGYIGRGLLLMNLALWLLVILKYNKKVRIPLIILTCITIPFILYLFYIYSLSRMNAEFDSSMGANIFETLLYQEINFAETFQDIVRSGQRIDLKGFFIWLMTLPIPKFLLGGIKVPLINIELSEIVLEMNRNDDFFWVRLNGFVSESYYIFGPLLFWLEAILFSRVAKTIYFFLRNLKDGEVLIFYCSIFLSFMYSRAGLAAIMPAITNGFLLFYFYFWLKLYYVNKLKNLKV